MYVRLTAFKKRTNIVQNLLTFSSLQSSDELSLAINSHLDNNRLKLISSLDLPIVLDSWIIPNCNAVGCPVQKNKKYATILEKYHLTLWWYFWQQEQLVLLMYITTSSSINSLSTIIIIVYQFLFWTTHGLHMILI